MMELMRQDSMVGNVMGHVGEGICSNYKGDQFLDEATKKRWSKMWAIHLEFLKGNGPIYFDDRGLTEEQRQNKQYRIGERNYPDISMEESLRQRGFDTKTQRIETKLQPVGFLGGAEYKYNGGTSMEGLYAAGDEVWMGSLSGAFTFGRRAGEAAAKFTLQNKLSPIDEKQLDEIETVVTAPIKKKEGISPQELEEKIRAILTYYAGPAKTEGMLQHGLELTEELRNRVLPQLYARNPHELMRAVEARNILDVAEMHMSAALYRTETVPYGRHFLHRLDYPTQDPSWYRQRVVIKKENGERMLFKKQTTEQKVPTREEYDVIKEVKP